MLKILKYSALYVCVTLLTAVGMVFVARPSNNNNSQAFGITPEFGTEQEEVTAFNKIFDGIMSAQGFDVVFDANIIEQDADPILIAGQLYIDLSNGIDSIALQGALNVNDKISLDIAYLDNWIYLSIFDGKYKSSADNILDIVNLVTDLVNQPQDVSNTLAEEDKQSSNLDISQILLNLQNMQDQTVEGGHKLSCNLLGINLEILTDLDYKICAVNTGDIKLDKYTITPHIELTYLEEAKPIEINSDDYYDFAELNDLLHAIINTCTLSDFHLTTTLNVNMFISSIKNPITMAVPIDAKIKIVNKKPQIMASVGPIPVIAPVDNDVPYKFGDTVDGLYCGKNRMLSIYYADGYVYFYRTETVPVFASKTGRTYEKMQKITLEEFLEDPLMILSYGCGFQDIVMKEINNAMALAKTRENPIDFKNLILDYNWDGKNCSISLNLKELANNPQLDAMNITLITDNINGKNYITGGSLNVHMPISSAFTIDIEANDLTLNNIGETLDWTSFENIISNYPHKVDEKWQASDGKWELASSTTYTVFFEENGGEEVDNITDAIDTKFNLPTLTTRVEDNGETKTTYTFVGWYTTSNFEENSQVTEGKVARGDTTLYAKWDVETINYYNIVVINKLLNINYQVHALCGAEFDIKLQYENTVITSADATTTYSFVGWFEDETYQTPWTNQNLVPNYNVTLYAKWDVVNVVKTKLLNIYDNGILVSSTGQIVGNALTLPTDINITENTKWYADANYITEITLPTIMPDSAIEVHIRNLYTVTIIDNSYKFSTITLTGYQGENLTLPSYSTKIIDDGSLTKQESYIFNGYSENLVVFPNSNTTIYENWEYDVKYYYTINFSKDPNFVGGIKENKIEFPVTNLRVLEGTVIDLTTYTPTWIYSTEIELFGKVIGQTWWHYNFEGWSTEKNGNKVTELTVSGDATIYANWDMVVKTGKN